MPTRPRTTSHLVLAAVGALWLAAVVRSIHYRDLTWLQYLFIDITWLQVLLLVVGGYGAFLVLVGALGRAPQPPHPDSARPMISMIVPAKNEEAVIEATVRSLCAQEYVGDGVPRYEVIIVDDRSTDGTAAILERLARELPITVVHTPDGSIGKAAALNMGIARARSDVVAIFDADARVAPSFLAQMVPSLRGDRVGGVQSLRLPYNATQNLLTVIQDDEYRVFQHTLQRARQVLGGMVSFAGNGLLLKREALDEVGGWNEEALTEDIDLSVRFHLAGWEIQYCGEAVVWEEAVPRMRDLMRQRIRWFEGAIRCLGDHLPGILFGRGALFKRIDMLFFLGGALAVTLALLTTYLYGLVDLVGGVVLYLQLPRRITTWSSLALTVMALAAMIVEERWKLWQVAKILIRSGAFSLHRLVVVPLAIHRYVRSAITGETSWEKTAHGGSLAARGWRLAGSPHHKDEV